MLNSLIIIIVYMQHCGAEMIWTQIAWDIDKDGILMSLGFYTCPVCHEGNRSKLSQRFFKLPILSKVTVE